MEWNCIWAPQGLLKGGQGTQSRHRASHIVNPLNLRSCLFEWMNAMQGKEKKKKEIINFISLYLKLWFHFQGDIFLTNKATFKTTIPGAFTTHFIFLIETSIMITVDSQAVVRNFWEKSHVCFVQFPWKGMSCKKQNKNKKTTKKTMVPFHNQDVDNPGKRELSITTKITPAALS